MKSDFAQLEMNFMTTGNRFRDYLDNGIFVVLFEHAAPGRDTNPEIAGEQLRDLEKSVLSISDLPCSLAITDGYARTDCWRAIDYAGVLSPESCNRHIVYLSGRDTTHEAMQSLVSSAREYALSNLVVVSGEHVTGETARMTRKRPFTESLTTLGYLSERTDHAQFFPGAVVNGHFYQAPPLLGQYFKMVRKLNNGANFLVTQAGFDMAQLESLRRYLNLRSLDFPTIARLLLLTPERVEKIVAGRFPGIAISPDFLNILKKELQFSTSQFEAAQYRRLELQAVGCKLLGYSGIQVAGIASAEKMHYTASRIAQALKEFTSIEQWLEEYHFYLARSDMAPDENYFYLFDKLLQIPKPGDSNALLCHEYEPPKLGAMAQFRHRMAEFLLDESAGQSSSHHYLQKKLLAGCRGCEQCRLVETQFYCVNRCPKRLANGPCGGMQDDGSCEVAPYQMCVHCQIVLQSLRANRCDALENGRVEQA